MNDCRTERESDGHRDEVDWGWQARSATINAKLEYLESSTDRMIDVTFRVGFDGEQSELIGAHKVVLGAGSTVFEAMLYGDLAESRKIIDITDMNPETFRNLKRYMYTDDTTFLTPDNVMQMLYAAKKYGMPVLTRTCIDVVKQSITLDTVTAFLTEALALDEVNLIELCLAKISENPEAVLHRKDFCETPATTVLSIVKHDKLPMREIVLYRVLNRWATHGCASLELPGTPTEKRQYLGKIFDAIRFNQMTAEEIANGPAKDGILSADERLDLYTQLLDKSVPPLGRFTFTPRLGRTTHAVARRFPCETYLYPYPESRFTVGLARPHCIRICANNSVLLHGLGLIPGKTGANVNVSVRRGEGTVTTISATLQPEDKDQELSVREVLFAGPVQLRAKVDYDLVVYYLKGSPYLYGTEGLRYIELEGGCQIEVKESKGWFSTDDPTVTESREIDKCGQCRNCRNDFTSAPGYTCLNPKAGKPSDFDCGQLTSVSRGQIPWLLVSWLE